MTAPEIHATDPEPGIGSVIAVHWPEEPVLSVWARHDDGEWYLTGDAEGCDWETLCYDLRAGDRAVLLRGGAR
jgi:hypothetical protein